MQLLDCIRGRTLCNVSDFVREYVRCRSSQDRHGTCSVILELDSVGDNDSACRGSFERATVRFPGIIDMAQEVLGGYLRRTAGLDNECDRCPHVYNVHDVETGRANFFPGSIAAILEPGP